MSDLFIDPPEGFVICNHQPAQGCKATVAEGCLVIREVPAPEPVVFEEVAPFALRTLEEPQEQRRNEAAPSCGPPAFDLAAICEYVLMRHAVAAGMTGKFVVIALTPEQKVRWIGHFAVGDAERMLRSIAAFDPAGGAYWFSHSYEPINLYCPLALFHPNIPARGKGCGGRELDVIASFAAVADQDGYKREGKILPFFASCRLETSPGSFHDWFVFPQPLPFARAKATLAALNRLTGNDDAEKDCSHVWRIAGTLNYPTAAKIAGGRSPSPFLVRCASDCAT
jgi:RepB DNA-primase from phage plasmid